MKIKIILYSLFFACLILVVYFFENNPSYNNSLKLPVLSNVQPFKFINQDSIEFTEKNMLGKICVVNYFFTTCKGICPKMNGNLKEIYNDFKDKNDFLIISHTSKPETDNIDALKKYQQFMEVNNNWVFLTGDKINLYKMARNAYLLDDPNNNISSIKDQFLHTQFIALVDKNLQIRGRIYDGLKKDELAQLKKDIITLYNEIK